MMKYFARSRSPIYESLISLYPYRFKKEYAKELIEANFRMVNTSRSSFDKIKIRCQNIIELLPWIVKENASTLDTSFPKLPVLLQINYVVSGLLIMPFLIIVTLNRLSLFINHTLTPVLQTLNYHWTIYTIILPMIALVLLCITFFYSNFRLHINNTVSNIDTIELTRTSSMLFIALGVLSILILV